MTLSLVRDRKKIDELWRAEYWDSPSSTIGFALNFVSSLVTGKEPDAGENKKLNFK